MNQPERRSLYPEIAQQIDHFLKKLQNMAEGNLFPFTFEMDDISGNSYIKNPFAPNEDP